MTAMARINEIRSSVASAQAFMAPRGVSFDDVMGATEVDSVSASDGATVVSADYLREQAQAALESRIASGLAVPGPTISAAPPVAAADPTVTPQVVADPDVIDPAGQPDVAPAPSTDDTEWFAVLPERGQTWAPLIDATAERHGVDSKLLAALVWSESAFDPNAVSSAGAIGLGQLMPGTAAELGVDPWDPEANLDGAARYLATQLDRFGRNDLALAAYNAGPSRVARAGGIPNISETQTYVQVVLDRFVQLGGSS